MLHLVQKIFIINLQSKKEYLKYQKDLLALDNKELEYKYKIGQISDSDFITQFKQTAAKKTGYSAAIWADKS